MSSDVYGTNIQTEISARKRYALQAIIALLVSLSVILLSSFVDSGAIAQARDVFFATGQTNGQTNGQTSGQTSRQKTGQSTELLAAPRIMRELPMLGNTGEADRLMLREIGDGHIFGGTQTIPSTQGVLIAQSAAALASGSKRNPHHIEPPVEPHEASRKLRAQASQKPLAASTTWQFVQQSTRLSIPENDEVANYREQYLREAIWISKILNRATPFVGHIVEELDKRFLPVELALLPAIESGYQPDVHSTESAAGIWQIIPGTAREIGLKRTQWFDGRADIAASTTAAIDYLSYLNAEFHGDWLLTLAAYNAGPGRVRGAIKRNKKRDLPLDFWSLSLPEETRNYVPKFLALVAMLRQDKIPGLDIPTIKRGNAFEAIDVGQRVSLDRVAQFSQINEKTLRLLNASLIHAVTPPTGPHVIYVPLGQGKAVLESLSRAGNEQVYSLPATYTVVAGDTLSSIAARYGISQRRMMNMNSLDNSLIKIGQQLATRNGNAESDFIEYVVTIGDTLSAIAHKFSVRIDAIRSAEGDPLGSDVIHPGVRLSIVLDTLGTG